MALKDDILDAARKASEASRRAESMSNEELVNNYRNNNYSSIYDKAAQYKEAEYRTGKDERPGCFITTAVCESFDKPDDCYELTMFRDFRDNWLVKQEGGSNLVQKYYEIAPGIVRKINAQQNARAIYLAIWTEYLKPCLDYIEQKNYAACKQKYVQMVETLTKQY